MRATLAVRPDLLQTAPLTREDALTLADTPRLRPGRNLSLCLLHAPVWLDEKKTGVSSLTNLDIHDIARLSRSYALDALYVVTPLRDQLQMLETVVRHWTREATSPGHADRRRPLGWYVLPLHCKKPWPCRRPGTAAPQGGGQFRAVARSPKRRAGGTAPDAANCAAVVRGRPGHALPGHGQRARAGSACQCDGVLRPLRYLGYNHLSVRSAAAILTDRILGDYY